MPTPPAAADDIGDSLVARLDGVAGRIRAAAAESGRAPAAVRLLLATKTIEPARILSAVAAGYPLIGENRVQEVVAKAPELAAVEHDCHFIGHLQANKINQVLPHVSCVQTVDSAELAQRLGERAGRIGRTLEVFLQVNVSGEASKFGIRLAQAPELLEAVSKCAALRVGGYMTIGLNSPDLAAVRAGYRALTDFRDDALTRGLEGAEYATQLSMGMSGDFAEAIAEGATMVRLGSAVFGARPAIDRAGPEPRT